MGMLDPRQVPPRRGMLPADLQAQLMALIAQDPTGTGGVAQPSGMTPSWQQFARANPLPQASVAPQMPAPPMMPGMPPPGGMGQPMGMPTYSQQQDQAAMPPGMPPMAPQAAPQPQIAPGPPGQAAEADPFFQALVGGMGGPCGGMDMPSTASFPTSPAAKGGAKRVQRRPTAAGGSESDALNRQMLAGILARRGARA